MAGKKQYRTRQRDEILHFFETHGDKRFSAREVIDGREISVGEATVYRCLAMLAEDGKLERTILKPGGSAYYQYVNPGLESGHCRLTCVQCGESMELTCPFLANMEQHIKADHAFQMDSGKTVIYGVCKSCGAMGEKNT